MSDEAPTVSAELAIPDQLPDVVTGELLPATPENAHQALVAIRVMRERCSLVKEAVEVYLTEHSRTMGTKTIHTPEGDIVAAGGVLTAIDADALEECLREAGCPEARIREVVVEEHSFTKKVDRRVLRQLTASNEDYKAAAELASRTVETTLHWNAK